MATQSPSSDWTMPRYLKAEHSLFFSFFLALKKQLIVWALSVYDGASVYMYDNRNSQSKPNRERWIGLMSGHPWVCPHQSCSSDQWCTFEANLSIFPMLWFRLWSSLLSSQNGLFLDETKPEDVLQLVNGIRSTMTSLRPILSKTPQCILQDQISHTNFYSIELLLPHHITC